jgi:hypothetical protein
MDLCKKVGCSVRYDGDQGNGSCASREVSSTPNQRPTVSIQVCISGHGYSIGPVAISDVQIRK